MCILLCQETVTGGILRSILSRWGRGQDMVVQRCAVRGRQIQEQEQSFGKLLEVQL